MQMHCLLCVFLYASLCSVSAPQQSLTIALLVGGWGGGEGVEEEEGRGEGNVGCRAVETVSTKRPR